MLSRMRYAIILLAAACTYSAPASVAPERAPTTVIAPFDRTWTAAIDYFADLNVPIRTLDRTSGFAATEELTVSDGTSVEWADCGDVDGTPVAPMRAVYNVRVRGDSARSMVRVTVRWVSAHTDVWTSQTRGIDCVTTGKWELDAELAIQRRAEGRKETK
jgi:hypothetical protein